ncbi:Hsp20/alpha crystallin family protein [Mesonia aestuariivivens]|uniref:Hsp20/alpha crystallin family protein n=1 Tax=Mesonia aestuariivivens TaxID=2796128 RepID=A0ABS6W0F3_9FLAO|nr:Hsp20/alpha crystallin family protein [Mesonia aestuariivivens]MBW2961314.1 Hsp20/alpha crystallin family protein [Mesonia aestuariivivens]
MSLVKRTTADNWLPSVIDDMFRADWLGGTSNINKVGVSIPAVNIQEEENKFLIEVAAPGKTREEFNIELNNDVLTISSEIKNEKTEDQKSKFTRREFSYHAFKRAFSLPENVDYTKITASYENGILMINLPKKEEEKEQAKRVIEIS